MASNLISEPMATSHSVFKMEEIIGLNYEFLYVRFQPSTTNKQWRQRQTAHTYIWLYLSWLTKYTQGVHFITASSKIPTSWATSCFIPHQIQLPEIKYLLQTLLDFQCINKQIQASIMIRIVYLILLMLSANIRSIKCSLSESYTWERLFCLSRSQEIKVYEKLLT